jgi:hypothetical protein
MLNTSNYSATILNTLVAVFFLCSLAVHGDTFQWTGALNDNWAEGGNWSLVSGSSGRTYPNDSTDIARLDLDITSDQLVQIPAGGITVDQLLAGDASHNYIIGGTGTLALGTHNPTFSALNGGTVLFNTTTTFGTNATNAGAGKLVLNAAMTSSSFFRTTSNLAVQINAEMQGGFNPRFESGDVEIGTDSLIAAGNPNPVQITGQTFRAVGGHRTIDDDLQLHAAAGSTTYTLFDGTNGNNLTVTGSTSIKGRAGRDFHQYIDTATLELSGNVTWNMTDDRSNDLGDRPDAITFVNNGALVISGSGNTYTDISTDGVNMQGTGRFIVNNTSGSATGTGNNLWIGPDVLFGGDGSVTGSSVIVRGGTVSPGNSIGDLDTGAADFEAGSNLIIEFEGDSYDQLNVDGALTVSDDFTIDLVQLGIRPSTDMDLISFTGAFTGIPTAWNVVLPDASWYFDTIAATSGSNGVIRISGLVPEPTSAVLLAIAATTLFRRRR